MAFEYDDEKYKTARRPRVEEDFDSPLESLIREAEQVRNSTRELWRLLMEIPQNYLDKAKNEVAEFYVTYLSLNIVIGKLLDDKNKVKSKDEFEKILDQASDLLDELRELKNDIDTKLTESAETDPTTGPAEELAVLPVGEVVLSESVPKETQTFESAVVVEGSNQDVLSTNLDPVADTNDNIFNRPIGTVPAEERLAFSDLETQQPNTLEEEGLLKLLRLYQAGSREVFKSEGKFKHLEDIKEDIGKLFHLVGHSKGRIEYLFNTEIRKITKEIFRINKNLVLLPKEKSKRLDEAYGQLLEVAQKNLLGREHRFDRSPVSTTVDSKLTDDTTNEGAKPLIPAQYEEAGDKTDQNAVGVNNVSSVIPPGLDLSQVPTLGVDDIVHDPLVDKGEFKGVAQLNEPAPSDGVENFPDYKKDIEEVDYQFVVTQATLMVVSKVLSRIGLRSIPDLEVAEKLISEYNDTDETDIAPAVVIKSEYLVKLKKLLEKLRLIKIKGVNDEEIHLGRILELDGDQVLVERMAYSGSKVTAEWVTLAELKKLNAPDSPDTDIVSGLPANDTTVPFVRDSSQNSADKNNGPVSPDADKTEPKAIEDLPLVDQTVDTTPEVSAIEESLSTEELYIKEKERYSGLRDSIYEKRLGLKFYYELDRAEIHIQTIDYVLSKYKDDDPIKEQKIKDNVSALSKINTRLAEGLLEDSEKIPKPLTPPTPEPATVVAGAIAPSNATHETPESSYLDLVADDPLMKSAAEKAKEAETLKAEWRESVGLASERPVDVLKPEEREILNSKYKAERAKSIEARRNFKEIESDYQFNLKEFYNQKAEQSVFGKLADGTRKLFGGQPKLTPKLEGLEIAYKQARKEYAIALNEALFTRSGATFGNKIYSETSDSTKQAFGEKFILKPRKVLLKFQEDLFLSQQENSKWKPVIDLMRKHKGKFRALGLLTAAGVGAATGGAALAGLHSVRWGVSTFGGAALAEAVYRQRQSEVDKIKKSIEMLEEDTKRNFSIGDIDSFGDSLTKQDYKKEIAEIRKKALSTGAAIGFGGLMSAGASMIDIPSGTGVARVQDEGAVNNGSEATTSTDEAIRLAHERRTLEIEQRVNDINRAVAEDNARVAAERMGVSYRPPAGPVANEAIQSFAVTPETLLQMGGVKVPHYSPSGELISQTTVSNIRLEGTNLSGLVENALPDSVVTEVYSYINMRVNDILAAHPNFSQIQLEKELFKDLENVYGGKEWWTSAKINEVKIGSMVTALPGVRASIPGMGAVVADVTPVDSMLPGEAMAVASKVVKDNLPVKGDTPTLVDQPYPFSGKEPILYTRSGGLSIEQADAGVASVPIIKAIYNPLEAPGVGTLGEVVEQGKINHVPLMQSEPTPLPPDPEKYVAAGNYTQSPAFRDYVSSEYGGMERFNKIVLREALEVEGETYDIFNKWLNEYQSPYEMSLAKMTIGDLKEAFGGPELGSRGTQVDATGLPKQYNTDAIRQYASANNFNYETVRKWLVALEDLKKEFPHQNATTLEDLFARSIIKADLLALKAKGVSV